MSEILSEESAAITNGHGTTEAHRWTPRAVQVTAVVVLLSGYVCASIAQQVYWGNDLLLLVRGHDLYPGSPYAVAGLAKEYSQRGAHTRAIELAESVVRDHPDQIATMTSST